VFETPARERLTPLRVWRTAEYPGYRGRRRDRAADFRTDMSLRPNTRAELIGLVPPSPWSRWSSAGISPHGPTESRRGWGLTPGR